MCSWETRSILLKLYFCVQYKVSCKSCMFQFAFSLRVKTKSVIVDLIYLTGNDNIRWYFEICLIFFLIFSWIEMIRAKWVRRWWQSGGGIAVVSGINHNRLCNKPQSHIFVFRKIKKLFFTFAFLGGVHIEVFIYIHLVRENLWWENTNRTFWMSSKNNWYYPQFKTSFMCQRSLTLFHVFFMYNKLFIVFAVSKRDQVFQLLYITLHRLESSLYRGVFIFW